MSDIRERGNICRKGQFTILNLVLSVDSWKKWDIKKYLKEEEEERKKEREREKEIFF